MTAIDPLVKALLDATDYEEHFSSPSRDALVRPAVARLSAVLAAARAVAAADADPLLRCCDVLGPVAALADALTAADREAANNERHSCGQCGWSGTGFHACPGLPGENEW
jgi:hypothetical protein